MWQQSLPTHKKRPPQKTVVFCKLYSYYWLIAPVGQTPAHVPQSRQASASITYCVSPAEIAPTGHSPAHVPQLTHESEITYAIMKSSLYNNDHYSPKSAWYYSSTKEICFQEKMHMFLIWHNTSYNNLHSGA